MEGVSRNSAEPVISKEPPVALHTEGVGRNLLALYERHGQPRHSLCEGRDKSLALTIWLKEVALRAESGDRNVDRPEGASQFQSIARGGRNKPSSSCYFYTCSAPDAQNPRFFCGSYS